MKQPIIKLKDTAQLKDLWRQLAALGYRRNGMSDLNEGYASLRERWDDGGRYLYSTSHKSLGLIDPRYAITMMKEGDLVLLNSPAHLIAYVKRHDLAPAHA